MTSSRVDCRVHVGVRMLEGVVSSHSTMLSVTNTKRQLQLLGK